MSKWPFAGIDEKLDRSCENIKNLEREIDSFFKESGHVSVPDNDVQLLLEAVKRLEQQPVPLRFSVLAGEIVHHLRSCFDHLAWHFSTESYRIGKHSSAIGFPVLEMRPAQSERFTKYERKIGGITDGRVLAEIERLQPYSSANPLDSYLLILHNMDITDKHKELVLCYTGAGVATPSNVVFQSIAQHKQGIISEAEGHLHMQQHAKIVPTIAFRKFRGREIETVIMALAELHNFTVGAVERFSTFV